MKLKYGLLGYGLGMSISSPYILLKTNRITMYNDEFSKTFIKSVLTWPISVPKLYHD